MVKGRVEIVSVPPSDLAGKNPSALTRIFISNESGKSLTMVLLKICLVLCFLHNVQLTGK